MLLCLYSASLLKFIDLSRGVVVIKKMTRASLALILLGWMTVVNAGTNVTERMDPEAILDRIKPVSSVSVDGNNATNEGDQLKAIPSGPTDPKKIYVTYCTICHQAGVAGAPKFESKEDWDPRMAKGLDALLQNVIHGLNAMPPKGTCMQCSDDALKATIEYMLPK